jgi:hypothetical protein
MTESEQLVQVAIEDHSTFIREHAHVIAVAESLPDSISSLNKLTKLVGERAARWAWEQRSLRKRARERFPAADQMFFLKESLEQASHPVIASYHASKFPMDELVVDCTTGIGADLIALARRGPVQGFDKSAIVIAYAKANCDALGLSTTLSCSDSLAAEWNTLYAFADPSRRIDGKRITELSDYQPNVTDLVAKMKYLRLAGIKLSPLLSDQELESFGGRVEFVSFKGECREACIWLGKDVQPGVFAVLVLADGSTEELPRDDDLGTTHEAKAWIFDADPAAVRAHCLGTFCVPMLGDSPGYLTGDQKLDSPWLRAYQVIATPRFDLSEIKKVIREQDLKTPEIKQRGTKQDLIKLQKQLKSSGKTPCALILWAHGKSIRCALAKIPE